MYWSNSLLAALPRLRTLPLEALDGPAQLSVAALERAHDFAADRIASLFGPAGATSPADATSAAAGLRMLLLLPVGDRCNLSCRYCYEDPRRVGMGKGTPLMSVEALHVLMDKVLATVQPPFKIYLHGGEPLLRGLPFFTELVRRVRRHPWGDRIGLGVQTNGTLIDDQWAAFFASEGVNVGLSLDGPADIHDRNRRTETGRGSHARVIKGLELLQRHGVPYGVITVLTGAVADQDGAATAVLDYFRGLGVHNFDVHPSYGLAPAAQTLNVSPRSYARFMIELFEAWLQQPPQQAVIVRSFEHFFQGMTGVLADNCLRAGKCLSIIGVAPDGEVLSCVRPFDPVYRFGNLLQQDLEAVLSSPGFQHFAADEEAGRKLTASCSWSRLCGFGGCPHERLTVDGCQSPAGRHVYCTCAGGEGGYPAIFSHICRRVEEIVTAAAFSEAAAR